MIRYGFFPNDLHRSVLQNRDEGTVKDFFLNVVTPQEAAYFVSQSEQVEVIIRRSQPASARFIRGSGSFRYRILVLRPLPQR